MAQSEGRGDKNIVKLENGIAIRPLCIDDVKSFARHGNNRKIWNNLRNAMPSPYTEADAKWWIEHVNKSESLAGSGPWTKEGGAEGPLIPTGYAIAVDDEAVGSIALVMGQDVYFRSAEVGYWLGEEHWGKGIMSKVVPAFVDWAWKTFGILVRLNGEANAYNAASGALLTKAGFELEGRRRNAVCKNDQLFDVCMYGMLRPEAQGL